LTVDWNRLSEAYYTFNPEANWALLGEKFTKKPEIEYYLFAKLDF